jgi:hypothetical protein
VGYANAAPDRTVVQVACFDVVAQRLADSPFTILVVGNQSLPLQSAFVMSDGPALNPAGSWTSGPRPITVTHTASPGEYNVLLGTGNTPMSAKLVTGITVVTDTTRVGTRCIYAEPITGGLQVQCYDRTGAATDQGFVVVQVAGGRPGRRLGFALALRSQFASYTPHESYAFNSTGEAITATRSSVGHYTMHFAGWQQLPGHTVHVQVTAVGLLSYCNVVSVDDATDGLTVFVECRNRAGEFVDAQYAVLVIE